jgi:ribosomal protein S18 acetylase RimI-like enzyme
LEAVAIRTLEQTDIPAVAALLECLARKSITAEFSAIAENKLLRANDATAISSFVENGFRYHVAHAGGVFVGFVGVRNNSHLYHLFVAEEAQRNGVARSLWNVAKAACRAAGNTGRFTVNSSNNAIAVYKSFGFVRTAPTQDSEGVLYNPMVLDERGS